VEAVVRYKPLAWQVGLGVVAALHMQAQAPELGLQEHLVKDSLVVMVQVAALLV
jgi:hypothetical protein